MDVDLRIKLQPRASKNEVVGLDEHGLLAVRVVKPPINGQANKECVKVLADFFGIPKSRVRIVRGESSRWKLFRLVECGDQTVQKLESIGKHL